MGAGSNSSVGGWNARQSRRDLLGSHDHPTCLCLPRASVELARSGSRLITYVLKYLRTNAVLAGQHFSLDIDVQIQKNMMKLNVALTRVSTEGTHHHAGIMTNSMTAQVYGCIRDADYVKAIGLLEVWRDSDKLQYNLTLQQPERHFFHAIRQNWESFRGQGHCYP